MAILRTLFVGLAVASANASAWESKCLEHCTHSTENNILQKLYDACESYRYVLPRPKVYRKCKRAFDEALYETCPKACSETAHNTHIQNKASQNCKHEKNETPRPMSFDACKQGYHAGAQAAVSFAQGLRTKHEDAMAGGANDQQAEIEDAAAAAQAAAEAAKAAEAAQAAAAAAAAQSDEAAAKAAAKEQAEAEVAAEAAKAAELDAARVAARAAYEASSKKAAEESAAAAAAEEAPANEEAPAAGEADSSSLRGSDAVAAE